MIDMQEKVIRAAYAPWAIKLVEEHNVSQTFEQRIRGNYPEFEYLLREPINADTADALFNYKLDLSARLETATINVGLLNRELLAERMMRKLPREIRNMIYEHIAASYPIGRQYKMCGKGLDMTRDNGAWYYEAPFAILLWPVDYEKRLTESVASEYRECVLRLGR
ncbi:hypothetical protein NX059_004040 [Plenodomus lindquistii]|nr:hypothetical protein NX059_004040 [Plenodomus lindquistii]